MDKMGLIVFAKTGHVLGAFTRAADPEAAVGVEEVVGDGIQVRDPGDGDVLTTVHAQELSVEIVDRVEDVLACHRHYLVEDGVPTTRFAEAQLTYAPVVPTGETIIIVRPELAPVEHLETWVQIEDGPSAPLLIPVPVEAGQSQGQSKPLGLANGEYGLVAFAPGHQLAHTTITIV